MPSSNSPVGFRQFGDDAGNYASLRFLVEQTVARMATSMPVKVISCSASGTDAPIGKVVVQPLVNQMTPDGKPMPHGKIFGVPYFRYGSGASAVIMDPAPGDLGIACFASHDISSVLSIGGQANPGSLRRFDMSDAIYIGTIYAAAPTQYIRFYAGGIDIRTNGALTMTASTISISRTDGSPVAISPDANIGGKQYLPHVHTGVQFGPNNTGTMA